jgi:mono/diheme cytochrome c family protein
VRLKTILLGVVALVAVLVLGAISAVGWAVVLGPDARPVTDRVFEVTEARLERGRYLVTGPAACLHCHTEHVFSRPDYPILAANAGSGWDMPIPELGRVVAPNITSDPETGIGAWTDDEFVRAIQEGVSRDGSALFPVMPYPRFAQLDDEDVASIVVYIRSLAPVRAVRERSELIFPLNFIVNTIPTPVTELRPSHPAGTAEERGAYLALIAGCEECHSPIDAQGTPLPGLSFSGGGVFHDPGQNMREVFSQNITPDASGLAHYDESFFLQVIRTGQVPGRTLNHIMPFEFFRNMTDNDLLDLWAYIRTRPAVSHRISNTESPTPCPVCGQTHGLGQLNPGAGRGQ